MTISKFILNQDLVEVHSKWSETLLDFIRYTQKLPGTKVGCREGDCGACVVLVGGLEDGIMKYRSITSCLTPVANVIGKHVVTVEGINLPHYQLNVVQDAIVECGGTQCGACTPGFVVSLTGYSLGHEKLGNLDGLKQSIDGNICRCTGYKSLERACERINQQLSTISSPNWNERIDALVDQGFIPPYFKDIPQMMAELNSEMLAYNRGDRLVAGGSDLYVQVHHQLQHQEIYYLNSLNKYNTIDETETQVSIGALCTSTQIMESAIMQRVIPDLTGFFGLIASTPIRNLSSLGGNIVNASPIADMVIIFLVFDPQITIKHLESSQSRTIKLQDLYLGYKELDLQPGEIITHLLLEKPASKQYFNFEKVCKRRILDIASVNTACLIEVSSEGTIERAGISAGGVAPVPTLLHRASSHLLGKQPSLTLLSEVMELIDEDISPISDIRGSKEYKRQLLHNLIRAHFLVMFPETFVFEEVIT